MARNGVIMIVLAAGQGRRFGGSRPKQYQPLRHRPILWHAMERLHNHPQIDKIIPVIAPNGEELWHHVMGPFLAAWPKTIQPVIGGKERQDSVFSALRTLTVDKTAWVGIHDGARPLVTHDVLNRLFKARQHSDAIIPALSVSDTVKHIDRQGTILNTLDRTAICLAQTPQLFRFGLIFEAHRRAAETAFAGTDDASLVERLPDTPPFSNRVTVVPGTTATLKITHPVDIQWAEQHLREEGI